MATKKRTYPTKTPDEIPEVKEYETALKVLRMHEEDHAEVFSAHRELAEEVNQKLQKADAAVRAKGVNCGDFRISSVAVKYDVERLFQIIGKEAFLELGGASQTRVSWDLDKAKLELAAETGKIPTDVVEAIRTITMRYSVPKPV